MVEVLEFKNIHDLNDWFENHKIPTQFEVIPIARTFQSPETKLFVSAMSYILVRNN